MTEQPGSPFAFRPPVVVLGATGAVGARVAAILETFGHEVIAVSRHPGQTAALPNLRAVRGEFKDPTSIGEIDPGIAVNCTGIEDAGAVQRWREAGWAIVDITASSFYADQLAHATRKGLPS